MGGIGCPHIIKETVLVCILLFLYICSPICYTGITENCYSFVLIRGLIWIYNRI